LKKNMEDNNNDTATLVPSNAAATDNPNKKRRKRGSSISRHKHGKQKKTIAPPHAPELPRNPPQPLASASALDTTDSRIFNLKRAEKRRDKRIEELSTANQQLERKVRTTKEEMQSVQHEAAMKVNAMETETEKFQHEAAMKVKAMETRTEKYRERADKKMKRAVEASTKANAKTATATKAITDAKEMKKEAAKAKTATAKERKQINNNKLAVQNKSKKQLATKDETIAAQEEMIRELKQQLKASEKNERDALEEASKEKASREEMEMSVKDMEQKLEQMEEMIEELEEAGQVVIKKESVKGTGFKKWSEKIIQLIMEYLVRLKVLIIIITSLIHTNTVAMLLLLLHNRWLVEHRRLSARS